MSNLSGASTQTLIIGSTKPSSFLNMEIYLGECVFFLKHVHCFAHLYNQL